MNTYMKMSAKEQDHREFLNSLRERLNVPDETLANLEKRITGKSTFRPTLAIRNSERASLPWVRRRPGTRNTSGHPRTHFTKFVFSAEVVPLGNAREVPRAQIGSDSLSNL